MRRYLPSSAVNGPVGLGVYTKSDDDQTYSDDLCCRGRWRGGNLARPCPAGLSGPAPRLGLFGAPGRISPAATSFDDRRRPRMPDFDALDDDDERRTRQAAAALPPPGSGAVAQRSRDAPMAALWPSPAPGLFRPRRMPTGPVLSPDDPRYGRPAGPPPVIYADRPPGQPPHGLSGSRRRVPGAGIVYPNDDRVPRPPEASSPAATGPA